MTNKSKKTNLIIYGDSSFAQMIAHYFDTDSNFCVVAFCVDAAYKKRDQINGLPVVSLEEIEDHFSTKEHHIFAAIGYKRVRVHKELYQKISRLSYPVASYISSSAIIDPSCKIGQNCLVLPGTILEPFASVEENCFINSGAIICHHAAIEANSIVAAGSLVGGYSRVGECSLIGFQSTVAELLNLGKETLLGAGSLLLQDTQESTMYAGSPAKPIRSYANSGIVLAE